MSTGARTPEGLAALSQAGFKTAKLKRAAKALGCSVAGLTDAQRAEALAELLEP